MYDGSTFKDLGQFPIQSAQILTACGLDNAQLTTIVLCLNQTLTFSAPTKMKKVNKQCLLDTPRTVRVSEKTWQVIVRTRRP